MPYMQLGGLWDWVAVPTGLWSYRCPMELRDTELGALLRCDAQVWQQDVCMKLGLRTHSPAAAQRAQDPPWSM